MLDKVLLGAMTTQEDVAYYEYSNKIINVAKTVIGVIGTVLFPRACYCYANNDLSGMRKYYKYALVFTYLIGFASTFGILGVSDLFVSIYYGESFAICGDVIKVMTPLIVIVELGDIVRSQYIVPMQKDFLFTLGLILNAIINLIVSSILILYIGIYGAVIGSIAAELFGLIYQLLICKKHINIIKTLLYAIPYLIIGLIMFGVVYLIDRQNISNQILKLLLEVGCGAVVYLGLSAIFLFCIDKDRYLYISEIKGLLTKKNK